MAKFIAYLLCCAIFTLVPCCFGQVVITSMVWTEGQSLMMMAFFRNRNGDKNARTETITRDDRYIGYYVDDEEVEDAHSLKSSRLITRSLQQPHRGISLTVRDITKNDKGRYMFDISATSIIVAHVTVEQSDDIDVITQATTHPAYYASSYLGREGDTAHLNFTFTQTTNWELSYVSLVSKNDIDPNRLSVTISGETVTVTISNATQADTGNYKLITSCFVKKHRETGRDIYVPNQDNDEEIMQEQFGLVMVLPIAKQCEEGTYADPTTSSIFSTVCLKCSQCDPKTQITIQQCSSSSDAICACTEGTYTPYAEETCIAFSMCPKGYYMEVPGTHTSDRQCTPCPPETYSYKPHNIECVPNIKDNPDDKLIVSVSTDSDDDDDSDDAPAWFGGDNAWDFLSTICGEDMYVGVGDSEYEKRCLKCSVCDPLTQIVEKACATNTDTVCKCVEGMYLTSNRTCAAVGVCGPGFFMIDPSTPNTDVVCNKCAVGTYSKQTHNTECQPHTVCISTKRVTVLVGTGTADAVCTSCTKYNARLPACIKAVSTLQNGCYASLATNIHSQPTTVPSSNMLFSRLVNTNNKPRKKSKNNNVVIGSGYCV